jgi:hypothetical protein
LKARKKGRRHHAPKRHYKENVIIALADAGRSIAEISAESGIGRRQIRHIVEREQIRREAKADPHIDPATLSLTAQQKLAAAIRQHKRNLDLEFEARCREECQRWLNDVSLPQYAKELTELERTISERRGVMDRITYKKILACLHPDRVQDHALKKRYEEAFRLFTDLEKRVLNEKESPTRFRQMPRTYEELMAMKAKVQAERRAKRNTRVSVR